ncbi:hypothetical protein Taro_054743 [Colocasia esculenta]|uniref:MAR-binding filament-like protein 1 n=1 Tax=Colocasia esculenta TaxID=4460 RepID=A0A843XRK5_COLES|nr:hypothetical protein [Colocasia esculenta]
MLDQKGMKYGSNRVPLLFLKTAIFSSAPLMSQNTILSNIIQEIEPLDVSLIQKDVPMDTVDAMKRTISSMLGLLPSDQFHVLVEAFWEPLSKLLFSSMMTGYTLRNAEYRLCLERNLGLHEELSEKQEPEKTEYDGNGTCVDGTTAMFKLLQRSDLPTKSGEIEEGPSELDIQGLGKMTPEVQQYILHLQSRLSYVKKELHDVKRENAALQMQHFVGEEKNDLLDYLRSLQPEKVAELSEPACPELRETIHSIVHGLLATLSPKMQTKAPPPSDNAPTGALNIGEDDCAELVENTSLQFQPLISVSRDYLARLLFWCMLLGHHIRGLEYRLELMELLTLTPSQDDLCDGKMAGH